MPVLEGAREIVGERRITLVFDRGGWNPDLFAELAARGVDVLTYRKGKSEPLPVEWFEPHPGRPGEPARLLHDASVRLSNGLWMRQITRLVGERQTVIVTTRQDLPTGVLARRRFDRWRQESFFKYMRQEYDLDGLCEYGAEDDALLREAPDPDWARLDKAVRKARAALQAILARTVDHEHPDAVIAAAQRDELRRQRNALPKRVRVGDMAEPTGRLHTRVKDLHDGLKTVAWQIETDLFRAAAPYCRRSEDEGRTLVTGALRSSGSLAIEGDQLIVTLAAQSSPHRTRAIAELCRVLDQTGTRFPAPASSSATASRAQNPPRHRPRLQCERWGRSGGLDSTVMLASPRDPIPAGQAATHPLDGLLQRVTTKCSMPAKESSVSRKPSLEHEVVEVLWDHGEASVRDVLERLPREYAYTTILTVLDRLHAKGVVEREKVEGAWHYRPARSRVATLAQAVASILDEARENPEPVYLAFLDHAEAVSPDALDRLEAMIRARRRPS